MGDGGGKSGDDSRIFHFLWRSKKIDVEEKKQFTIP